MCSSLVGQAMVGSWYQRWAPGWPVRVSLSMRMGTQVSLPPLSLLDAAGGDLAGPDIAGVALGLDAAGDDQAELAHELVNVRG